MDVLVSAIIQVIVLSIIPFFWWLITSRKKVSFFRWVGIKVPKIKNKRLYFISFILIVLLSLIPMYIIFRLFISVDATGIAISQFQGQRISALLPALVWAFLQTGLSEEIFFRGFLNKRLINKFGFELGNSIQSLIFGLMHGVFLFSVVGVVGAIVITGLTGIAGWFHGWMNEKQSDGSIISSWLLHGIGNIIVAVLDMFNLIAYI
ncbi:CPBP family glutamic-type intramembrane protease [Vallitalea sediminicola]